MQLLAKVDLKYTQLKNLGQWQTHDPDSQVIVLQAKVDDTLTKSINQFKINKVRLVQLGPKDPRRRPPVPEKIRHDDHPTWTPKDDSKQIVT